MIMIIIVTIITILLIARKLTFKYDQMGVTAKIPKNYKNAIRKTKIHDIKNHLHRIKNKIMSILNLLK